MEVKSFIASVRESEGFVSTALIRYIVGLVFLSEGIQKWIQPDIRGAGRFDEIGLPAPEFLGSAVKP